LNEKLKQRLVGAVVLVSLAVIFIPMLLDGDKHSTMPMFGSNIPDKPDYKFEPLDIPLQPVPAIPEERPVLIDKPEAPPVQEAKSPEKAEKPTAPSPASTSADKAETGSTKSAGGTAWVVQVGSFSRSENALALRDKLRTHGFTAFVERVKGGDASIYRVRVGPELKRENAEKALKQLQQKMKLKGIIMEFEA